MFRRILVRLLLAAGVAGVVAASSRSSVYQDLQLWSYDLLVNHGGYAQQSKEMVLVDFDDHTFANIRQFPIPRTTIAEVIDKVSAGKPKVIALDVLLSEPRAEVEDERMQQSLTNAGNVILASQAASGQLPGVRPLEKFCNPEDPDRDSSFCKQATPGALGYAFINMPIDRDGFIRDFLLFSGGSSPSLSFPVTVAQQFRGEAIAPEKGTGIQFLKHSFPYADPQARTLLIGSWSPEPAHTISAWSVLQNQVDLGAAFAGKLVLIGQGSDAARDRHFTPVFRPAKGNGARIRLSGTQVQAAAIDSLLSGRSIRMVGNGALWIVNLVFFAGMISLLLRSSLRYGSLLAIAAAVVIYAVAQALFTLDHAWFRFVSTELGLALSIPVSVAYQFIQERFLRSKTLLEREQVMGLFSRYVSPEVAREIWDRRAEVVLAGEERVATVLFSDIRSFTAITAGKSSAVVLEWLNEYLTEMDEVITAEGGFLNKFIGDGLMILFGVPLSNGVEEDARRALRCAQKMVERVAQMNEQHRTDERFPALKIGVGIHTGKLTCGNIGSAKRLEYSVIGETVNLASRLESLTKEFHTDIVISAATYQIVQGTFPGLRDLGESPVRGFDAPIRLYAVTTQPVASTIQRSSSRSGS
jgi:adenylate cyclase